jgi:hypothetical protein
MKFLFLFGVALLLNFTITHGFMGLSRNNREPPIPTRKSSKLLYYSEIEQKVDNFDPQNNQTWQMRYIGNDEHFQAGGPIFIYIGGEWTISAGSIMGGLIWDMAKEHNGYLFYTEHRYYGQSHPTPDISTENLRYLNVDQALADLAHFIVFARQTIPGLENSKVILVGGSYSATMAVWFRQKYPHLAVGSWASSAPLLAKVDFVEYKEVVGDSIKLLGGEECYNAIQQGFLEIENLIKDNQFEIIEEKFNLCDRIEINSELDKWFLFDTISEEFSGLVQYHRGDQIKNTCDVILAGENHVQGIANWVLTQVRSCVNGNYTKFVSQYREYEWTGAKSDASRQWLYQTCAEYGWYQSSGSEYQPFGSSFPADLYVRACSDIYGTHFTPQQVESNVQRSNIIYGAMSPGVTNVYFTQGQLDPWRPMGIQEDYNESSPARVIPLASHCGDLGSISAYDNEEMVASKLLVKSLVASWLRSPSSQ